MIVTMGGTSRLGPRQPVGNEKFNVDVDSYINFNKQARHVRGTSSYAGGGYFSNESQAQDVLDAYQRGGARVVGRGSDGGHVVIYNGVTGFNNNPRQGILEQPTNRFWIKGTSSPSVVPLSPVGGSRP